jgi:PKD repeat protein
MMFAMLRSRYRSAAFLTTLFILLAWQPQAQAFSSFLNDFNDNYNTAGTRLDQCIACHTSNSSVGSRNPYGSALANANINFGAIENVDSDGDGFSNLTEIMARTFPGNPNDFPIATNQPPTADPNGPYNGTLGSPVSFNGSGSSDSDGTITSYNWDFGDGASGTGVSPSHIYGTDGTFTVSLMVTDNDGATDTASTTATIALGNQPPIADPNGPYSGTVGLPVSFDGSDSSDPDGTIISHSWDFGDGSSGMGVNPSHSYNAAGTYNVTLTIMDNAGATDSGGTTATISNVANLSPVADANGPYSGTAGSPVTFDGTASTDPDGSIVSYDWNFGDGTIAMDAGATPSHTYGSNGSFTVMLTVTDNAGVSASDSTTANIGNVSNEPPVADANGPYSGTVGSPVSFDGGGSSDPDGSITAYQWNFGDGSTGTGVNPDHAYNTDGSFTVTLMVTDNAGASDTDTTTATIGVGNLPPTADANGPYSGTVNVAVLFDGAGSSDPENGPLTYAWDFGDGSSGTGTNPTHSYSAVGTYNVTLTVSDNAGATDSDMTTASITTITPPPPGDDDDRDDDRDDDDRDDDDRDDDDRDDDDRDDDDRDDDDRDDDDADDDDDRDDHKKDRRRNRDDD